MPTWREKQAHARQLVDNIKHRVPHVDNAEDALKLQKQFEDAQVMLREAGEERAAIEKRNLANLIETYEKGDGQQKQPGGSVMPRPVSQNGFGRQTSNFEERLMMRFTGGTQDLPMFRAALSEGTPGAGGYLVVPAYLQSLFAETRRQGNSLRNYGWLNVQPVDSNQVYIPQGSGAASVGIVVENQPKPQGDQAYTQLAVSIYTAAGISKLSNQLVQDSSPAALDAATRELATLLGNLEEQKIISGSGTGEPRGILNTTGIGSQTVSVAGPAQQAILDAILDAVTFVQQNYFGPPTGVLMHPRRLNYLLKGKDAATLGNYLFNLQGTTRQPTLGPLAGPNPPQFALLGAIPFGVSTNVPTNLGAGTNEDRIIVANWQEAWWFQRQDITTDISDVAGTAFENNQTWIRYEERFGFTAARYPAAFSVISGTSLNLT